MEYAIADLGSEKAVVFDLGDGTFGLFNLNGTVTYPYALELWHDHAFSGSGCNNLIIEAFGRDLDLEFCSSRALTPEERAICESHQA